MGVRLSGGVGPLRVSVPLSGRRRRRSTSNSGWLGFVVAIVVITLVAAWPWMLGTYLATKAGAAKHSIAWNLAGWIPESLWSLVILVVAIAYLANSIAERKNRAVEERKRAAALQQKRAQMRLVNEPWYDDERGHYTHSTCTVQHRSEGAAARCNSRV